jgi:type IV pilus assembly protein PilC
MPVYTYTALSASGSLTKGEGVAATPEGLAQELTARGLLVQSIRPKRTRFGLRRRRPVSPEDFLLFNQELLALLRAGLTLPEALALTSNRPDNPAFGQIVGRVREDVRGGAQFSEACARHGDVFEPLYLSTLKTGEKTGNLPNVLMRYQDYLKHRVALRKQVSRALAYPVFLLIALAVILGVLFTFVMPRFVAMYADFDAKLPWPTQLLLGFVEHLPLMAAASAALGAAAWWGWRKWTATEKGRLAVDEMKERLPYLGSINRLVAVTQLARSLATLLGGGTPLVEALRTAQGSAPNRAYGIRLERATQRVTGGGSLAQALREARLMPDTAVKLVEVGEASGSLDAMLGEVARFYEETLENRLGRTMSLIEPVLMLLMGVLIGGIIIVMYLPIFNMAEIIR